MKSSNLDILELVALQLKDLGNELVFVGGSVVELYLPETEATDIRPTQDIDCVVEISSKLEYHHLSEKLRARGFREAFDSNIICRWKWQKILVDVMPSDKKLLGFSNLWYPPGIENSILASLPRGTKIRIFSLPYFMASKLEAFKGRGQGDFIGSSDIEDIITLLDCAKNADKIIMEQPEPLRSYFKKTFSQWLEKSLFTSTIEGHIQDRINASRRAKTVLEKIRRIAKQEN